MDTYAEQREYNARQKAIVILELIRERGCITIQEAMREAGCSERTVRRILLDIEYAIAKVRKEGGRTWVYRE